MTQICETCAAYLGAGCCRDTLEGECDAGGGHEAWRMVTEFPSATDAVRYMEYIGYHGGFEITLDRDTGTYKLIAEAHHVD